MKRFHRGYSDDEVRCRLFDDLRIDFNSSDTSAKSLRMTLRGDAERLMRVFGRRAFRKPVEKGTLAPYTEVVTSALAAGVPFHKALRLGYRAILCSPRFLYITESPGALDSHEIASRLSYFLNREYARRRTVNDGRRESF